MSSFKSIQFPETSQYSSDSEHIPLEFYENAIPKSKSIDMVLGYFSTNAIKTLCFGFSQFIYLGGTLRIVTNHQLAEDDKRNLVCEPNLEDDNKIIDIFQDLEKLKVELGPFGQHFFDCLKYLIKRNRLTIIPVMHKPNAMAHYKKIILCDGENYLYVSGSANFTGAGIIKNGESFIVDKSWGGETEKARIKSELENFKTIFNRNHPSFEYISPEKIVSIVRNVGNDHTQLELLENAMKLMDHMSQSARIKKIIKQRTAEFESFVAEIKQTPKFPFPEEREIQKAAYQAWLTNECQGIFAMATGSGKTVTALNCVLRKYHEEGHYKAIVAVPTRALALQWSDEAYSFNFQNIICTATQTDWKLRLRRYTTQSIFNAKKDLILITTYATYNRDEIQTFIRTTNGIESFIYIADEVHNAGSSSSLKKLPYKIPMRIGLSATPERIYDEGGSNEIYQFFNSHPPNFTYRYTMKRAIEENILCEYEYHPIFVELTEAEINEYRKITNQLRRFLDTEKGGYRDGAEMLLLKRKRIVHKAEKKKIAIGSLLDSFKTAGKLKYTFVFVPEGYETDYSLDDSSEIQTSDIHILDEYAEMFKLRKYSYYKFVGGLSETKEVLENFEKGHIDVLLAMKCLDEGVDIPKTRHAIFCSSTGNPRQFIQRRGRVLRKSPGKEKAKIWDLVVIPPLISGPAGSIETNLFKAEVRRIANFAALASNDLEIIYGPLKDLCEDLNIDFFDILKQENESYD